jgi:hypothetical protein
MKKSKALFLILPVLAASCARPVSLVVDYPDSNNGKGSVKIIPSRPISGAKLVFNNHLLVENDSQQVKSITVRNLPEGEYGYQLTCNNTALKQNMDAKNTFYQKGEAQNDFLHEAPPNSSGYWVKEGLEYLSVWIALASLYVIYD